MQADALICSHPRSGGRWLRFLIAHYLTERYGVDWAVTPESVFAVIPDHNDGPARGYSNFRFRHVGGFPLVSVCHQPFSWELHRGLPTLFLARNPYDVVVSAFFHLTQEKERFAGSFRSFIQHPTLGLPAWITYMNSWAPQLLTHRDRAHLAYAQLNSDPAAALTRVLVFLNEEPDPELVRRATARAGELRDSRRIRTGQEGNFWDHLQPEEIFEIQEVVHRDLSDFAKHLLRAIGVALDPFPR
jgi:hypothetical protein